MSTGTQPLSRVQNLRVDDQGLDFELPGGEDVVVDVQLDGRRVWSLWTMRDSSGSGPQRQVPWPDALQRFLDGSVRLSIVDHASGTELAAYDAVLGNGEGRVAVVDPRGRPLGLDKSLALSRLFDSRDADQVAPLLDSISLVLDALSECGVEAFLAYGSLLGAVREGGLIGHDSDADLGYVSRLDHPADVVAESFRLQRALVERGYSVTRYSGMGVRINLVEGDGATRGLDVFGGFLRDGELYLMGEVGSPFRTEWVWPLSTVTFEGRRFPAPAEPERLLEATYGPGWRVPDPAYKFETPPAVVRRLDGWFRGTRGGRILEWDVAKPRQLQGGPLEPSAFVRWALAHPLAAPAVSADGTVVDLGCGAGLDTRWCGAQGTRAVGVDFKPIHFRFMAERVANEQLPVTFEWANLNELRSVLTAGAQLSRLPGPRVLLARHVLDAVDQVARRHFYRLAEMTVRGSGPAFVQVQQGPAGPGATGAVAAAGRGRGRVRPMDVDALVTEIEQHRGRVLERLDQVETSRDAPSAGNPREGESRDVTRLVVVWE